MSKKLTVQDYVKLMSAYLNKNQSFRVRSKTQKYFRESQLADEFERLTNAGVTLFGEEKK